MIYKEYNNNPKNKHTADCVVRSISTALNKKWEDVFEDLIVLGRELSVMPNNKEAYGKYLEEYETINVFKQTLGGRKRLKVNQVPEVGTYIVRVAKHLVTVVDGVIYDTWNCGEKCAYKIWRIN